MRLTSVATRQAEPVPRYLAIIVPDVEVVRILTSRAGHSDGLLAIFTFAEAGRTGIANSDAKISRTAAVTLTAATDVPARRAFIICFVAWFSRAGFGAGRP